MKESYENYKELKKLCLNVEVIVQIFMNDTDLTETEMIRTVTSYKIMYIHEQYDNKVKRGDQLQSETKENETTESTTINNDLEEIKKIFDEYYRNELKVKEQKEIDWFFRRYITTALEFHTLKSFIEELSDEEYSIHINKVVYDIKYDINHHKEFNRNK